MRLRSTEYPIGIPFCILAVAAWVLFPLASRSVAQDSFPARQYQTGVFPQMALLRDVNSDGRPDVLICNKTSNFVTILLGDGSGGFIQGTPVTMPLAAGSTMVCSDITTDGTLDVLTGGGTVLQLAPGFGNGLFAPPIPLAAGGTPVSLASMDVNGDSIPDIVMASASGAIVIHRGTGGGAFLPPVTTNLGLQPQVHASMDAADLNLDGLVDVAVTSYGSATLSVLYGNGFGGFTAPIVLPEPAGPWSVHAADCNADGFVDLVTGCRTPSNQLSINYNNTIGGFFPGIHHASGPDPRCVDVADMDQDGLPDLVDANSELYESGVSVLTNLGGLQYSAPVRTPAGIQPVFIAAGDLDGDNRPDVVAVNTNSYTVSILRNLAQGGLQGAVSFTAATAARSLSLGDLNADGFVDFAVANTAGYSISTMLGAAGAQFGPPSNINFAGPPQNIAVADLNGDRNLDYAVAVTSPARLVVTFGNGTGGFGPLVNFPLASAARAVTVADLDHDGRPDLAAVQPQTNAVSILFNTGGGAFSLPVVVGTGITPQAIDAGDMDGDGSLDLVTGDDQSISILLNNGAGALAAQSYFAQGLKTSVALGDLNKDGSLDAVANIAATSQIVVSYNTGLGSLVPPQVYSTAGISTTIASSVTIGDVNFDASPDIVVSHSHLNDGNFAVLYNNGAGNFANVVQYGLSDSCASVRLADLDLDGDLDVAASMEAVAKIAVSLNTHGAPPSVLNYGTGTPGCSGRLGLTTNVSPKVALADFGIQATNFPKDSLGLLVVTDVANFAGYDYFGINLLIHFDPLLSITYQGESIFADPSGSASIIFNIPNDPSLANQTFFFQAAGVEGAAYGATCSPAALYLVSSVGMAITVAP